MGSATMSRSVRLATIIGAVAVALLLGFLGKWLLETPTSIGRSDFTPTYVAATLLREGHGGQLYNQMLQTQLHSQVIAPDGVGNLPFVDMSAQAAVAVPVSLLSLDVAFRLWGLLQLAILLAATLVVVRAAPWPVENSKRWKLAASLAAIASMSTFVLLIEGQWSAVSALGLALAYHEWRAGRLARGGALLALSAGIGKPQLAIGLAGFMLGWRDRRLLAGAAVGAAASVAVSLAIVGPGGIISQVQGISATSSQFGLASFAGISGLAGVLFGNGTPAHVVVVSGIVAAFAASMLIGDVVRRKRCSLEAGCAAAALLTLLGSPHDYMFDLVLLTPVFVWTIAAALSGALGAASHADLCVVAVLACWTALSAAMLVCEVDPAFPGGGVASGAVIPAALMACMVIALVAVFHPDPATLAATS